MAPLYLFTFIRFVDQEITGKKVVISKIIGDVNRMWKVTL